MKTVTDVDRYGHSYSYLVTSWRGQQLLHYSEFPHAGTILESLHQGYKARPDDVWLCSFPKTGTNWTYEITAILQSGKAEPAPKVKMLDMVETHPDLSTFDLQRSPRLFNTHIHLDLLPPEVFKAKVIYPIRNPLSVALSDYYHDQQTSITEGRYQGSSQEYMKSFLYETQTIMDTSKGVPFFGSWFSSIPAWWKTHRDNPNVHFVFYEEMKRDPLTEIKQISKFLGKEYDDEFYQEVVKLTHIDKMKETSLHKSGAEYLTTVMNFFRKGQIDEWKEHFSEEEYNEFMEYYRKKMQDTPDLRDRIHFE